MGRERDNLEDEGTWQQPMPGRGARPEHAATLQQTGTGTAPDPNATAQQAAPEVTAVEQTAPGGDVTQAPDGATGVSTDSHRTEAMPGTGEWDAMPPPVFEPGRIVFGKYRLIEKIGEGGMGEVWRVWHVHLDAERALKLIKAELAHNDKGWMRFQREARLMAKINHPNAVSVFDFRRTQSVGYIEMEFIRGRSLTEVLKDRRDAPMPLDWTARVLEQLSAVLQEAHGHADEETGQPKPIIHRDLKPSNLMVVEKNKDDAGPPRLKVLDFGIAKIVEDDGSPELTGGDLVGTPAYMSPEQIRGGLEKGDQVRAIDGRSDLYAVGVVLYHLLTGALPFRGSRMAMLAAHLNTAPMPMKEANPHSDVPPAVERVVMQCLEKDPDRRPQTARELCDRFLQAARTAGAEPVRPAGRSRRTTAIAVAVVVVLAGVVGLAAAMFAGGSRRPENPPAEPPKAPLLSDAATAPVPPPKTPTPPAPPAPAAPVLWAPEGYEAVDATNIVPGHPGFPAHLRRLDDRAEFYYFADRVYLPEGYEPESPEDRIGDPGWPRALIRKKDKVRFVRIQGKVYRRGANGAPIVDFADKLITPHFVRVPGFYIQETEATNGELETYARAHPDDVDLAAWKDWLDAFRKSHSDAEKFPAAMVGYAAAGRYARSVGGLLPTEAEWEWAARSQHIEFAYAWGEDMTPPGESSRARLEDPNAVIFDPAPVGSYNKDKTLDGVFDMVGNVRELCADAYVAYTALPLAGNAENNPLVDRRKMVDLADPELKVVVRGGSFDVKESEASAFYRWRVPPREVPGDVGFRVVLECPPDAERAP